MFLLGSATLLIPILLSVILAINMGGSGTAPSFAAAYGVGIVRRSMIPILFGVAVVAGALLAGAGVSATLGKGLLHQKYFTLTVTSVILFAITCSLFIANLLGIPQSTSQSTVFAIVAAAHYLDEFDTKRLFLEIIPLWFVLPIISFVLMWAIAKWLFPHFQQHVFAVKFRHVQGHTVLKTTLIISSLYVAFAIGSNNVGNAAGPLASMAVRELGMPDDAASFASMLLYAMLIIAPCFGLGSFLLGHKVTESTGKDLVEMTPISATFIAFLTATLLLSASLIKGLPTSLVQLNVGAFMGYSVAKVGSKKTFENASLRKFFVMWALAPLLAYILSLAMLYLLDEMAVL